MVDGSVGSDSGINLHGGVIKIGGDVGQFLGFGMDKGTILVKGQTGTRAGACMKGGKIILAGNVEEVMPTFTIDSVKPKTKVDDTESAAGPFYVFLGDLAENGTGKLFISKANNTQLSKYERFL